MGCADILRDGGGGFSTPGCEEAAPANPALPKLCIQGAAVRAALSVTAHTHTNMALTWHVKHGNLEFHGV